MIDLGELTTAELEDLKTKIQTEIYTRKVNDALESSDFEGKLKFISRAETNEWLCYESGVSYRVDWEFNGKPLTLSYKRHSSKHTYTFQFEVKCGDVLIKYGHGNYWDDNDNRLEGDVLTMLKDAGIKDVNYDSVFEMLEYVFCLEIYDIEDCAEDIREEFDWIDDDEAEDSLG